jgi:hypothetical protein
MTHYWFGDSWLVGDELELVVPVQQRDQYVFPKLFSDHYNARSIVIAESGSAIDVIPYQFNQIVDEIQPNDQIFFCLSAGHRVTIFDEHGNPKQITPGPNYSGSAHPHNTMWYKYFDTPSQRVYNYDRTINLLWLWCQHKQLQCWFLNLFTTAPTTLMSLIPNNHWLVPRDQCIAQFIMPLIDNESGMVIDNDCSRLTTEQWENHKRHLEQYVRPGYCHPNIQGHQHIADELIKIYDRLRISTTST